MDNLEACMKECQFFDEITDLIPSEFYLSNMIEGIDNIVDTSNINNKKISKKKDKFKLSNTQSGSFIVNQIKNKSNNNNILNTDKLFNNNFTPEELKEKLHKKIEMLSKKRKLIKDGNKKEAEPLPKKRKLSRISPHSSPIHAGVALSNLEFSKIDLSTKSNSTAVVNKKKNFKSLISEAEKKQRRLEELSRTEEGKKIIDNENWNKAMQKAQGIKIKDNPSLLKKALKNKEKQKQKNRENWKNKLEEIENKKNEKKQKTQVKN